MKLRPAGLARCACIAFIAGLVGCAPSSQGASAVPPALTEAEVRALADEVTSTLGGKFEPVFVCGPSKGQGFQPTRQATEWSAAAGPDAIVLAIDAMGALEVLKRVDSRLVPVTADNGLVVPVKFDPVGGDIAVAVAYAKTGVSETYAFSTFDGGPSFLSWTVNIPQSGERSGGRGVQAFIAQCVELAITPAEPGQP